MRIPSPPGFIAEGPARELVSPDLADNSSPRDFLTWIWQSWRAPLQDDEGSSSRPGTMEDSGFGEGDEAAFREYTFQRNWTIFRMTLILWVAFSLYALPTDFLLLSGDFLTSKYFWAGGRSPSP